MKPEDMSTAEVILRDMQNKQGNDQIQLVRESISKLYPDTMKDWLPVSNLNHTQIMELNRILLIKDMLLPDTCEFLTNFVDKYIRMNVSKNAHGRHDIRDIFQGVVSAKHDDDGIKSKMSGIIGK